MLNFNSEPPGQKKSPAARLGIVVPKRYNTQNGEKLKTSEKNISGLENCIESIFYLFSNREIDSSHNNFANGQNTIEKATSLLRERCIIMKNKNLGAAVPKRVAGVI